MIKKKNNEIGTKEKVVRTLKLKGMAKISRVKGYECLSGKYVNGLKIRWQNFVLRLQPNKSCDIHSREKKEVKGEIIPYLF